MDNKNVNMILNINCESSSEYSNSLFDCLKICHSEFDKLNGKYHEIQGKLSAEEEAHTETKYKLKAEEKAHTETKDKLKAEEEAHTETKDRLKAEEEAHTETKDNLKAEKEAHTETKDRLKAEEEAHTETKDKLKAEEETHTETKDNLKAEKEAHTETQNRILRRITNIFDEISSLLNENLDSYSNPKLKDYVESIITQSNGGWRDCDTMDKLLYNCKKGSGAICRIANLLWWNKQDSLQYMMSMIGNIDIVEKKMDLIFELFKVAGHTIECPTCQLSCSIPNYLSYDDQRSNFIDIFTSEEYENGTLCELRFLSIDGAEGKMYIYYK